MKQYKNILVYKNLFKKKFGVKSDVVFGLRKPKKTLRGRYNFDKDIIVIYHSDNMLRTFIHELTHAYQKKYMSNLMKLEEIYRNTTNDEYYYRPIEQHARLVAESISKYLEKNGIDSVVDIDIKATMHKLEKKVILY